MCFQLLTFLCAMSITASGSLDEPQATRSISDVIAAQQPVVVKLFGAGAGNLDSYGTGILVSKEGHVLTVWNHLVSIGYLTAVTSDGRRFSVETLGTSFDSDAALLKLQADPKDEFPFVDLKFATCFELLPEASRCPSCTA
jgi:serine protease Do